MNIIFRGIFILFLGLGVICVIGSIYSTLMLWVYDSEPYGFTGLVLGLSAFVWAILAGVINKFYQIYLEQ